MHPIKTVISTAKAPAAIGPYSQAVLAGSNRLLFISGQIPLNPATGQVEAEDVKGQTLQVMANLKAILQEAGIGFEHVVKTTIYLQDMNDFQVVNGVYAEYFPSQPPARATVQVARLPKDVKVEIEAIASV